MHRKFSSGSRQAPDPIDQYLEKIGYYRKHTARDASSLFRVLSDQLYGTQMKHFQVRQKCVEFMRKRKTFYWRNIPGDYHRYLDEMSKPKTYGTFMELRAVAYAFNRNVILFERFTNGKRMIYHPKFKDSFLVFFSPERHFDSIYPIEYVSTLGFCQAVTYEILYKKVFKLPDIDFAVEEMLYSNDSDKMKVLIDDQNYDSEIIFEDGRSFTLDRPHSTNCILENYHLCHFHNKDFLDTPCGRSIFNTNSRNRSSVLPIKYMSCVRQLLDEGITPFPYKVAKALDPYMYRNIEFDSWSELKRERYQANRVQNKEFGSKSLIKCSGENMNNYPNQGEINETSNGHSKDPGNRKLVSYGNWISIRDGGKSFEKFPLTKKIEETSYYTSSKQNIILEDNKHETIEQYGIVSLMKKEVLIDETEDYIKQNGEFEFSTFNGFENYAPPAYDLITAPFTADIGLRSGGKSQEMCDENGLEVQKGSIDENDDGDELPEYCPNRFQYGYYADPYYGYSYGSYVAPPQNPTYTGNMPPYVYSYNTQPYQTGGAYYPPNFVLQQPTQITHPPHFPPPYYSVHNQNLNQNVTSCVMANNVDYLGSDSNVPNSDGSLYTPLPSFQTQPYDGTENVTPRSHHTLNNEHDAYKEGSQTNLDEQSKVEFKTVKIEKDDSSQSQSSVVQNTTPQARRICTRYSHMRKEYEIRYSNDDNARSNQHGKNKGNRYKKSSNGINVVHQDHENYPSNASTSSTENVAGLNPPSTSYNYTHQLIQNAIPPANCSSGPVFMQSDGNRGERFMHPPPVPLPVHQYTYPLQQPTPTYTQFLPPNPSVPMFSPSPHCYSQQLPSHQPQFMPAYNTPQLNPNSYAPYSPVIVPQNYRPVAPSPAATINEHPRQVFWYQPPGPPPAEPTPQPSNYSNYSFQNNSNYSANNLSR